MLGMKKALIYGCALLLLSCGGKTGVTSQSSSVEKENTSDGFSPVVVEAFSMDFYKGSDWLLPDTLSEALRKEPEASSLKDYSVTVYKDGIKNDTVYHYSISSHCMVDRFITLDSIHELYQSYNSNGNPHIFYQATRGKLDGVRQRWYYDGKPDWFEHYKDGKLHGEERRWHANGRLWQILTTRKYFQANVGIMPILKIVTIIPTI